VQAVPGVIPVQAGIQLWPFELVKKLGPCLRRGDGVKSEEQK
jgi:hypothetical protein